MQLSEICGELFQQMVPSLTPNVQQVNQLVVKRMESLRDAELKLETEKAIDAEKARKQEEDYARKKNELNSLRDQLNAEQADVSHQREQLYR